MEILFSIMFKVFFRKMFVTLKLVGEELPRVFFVDVILNYDLFGWPTWVEQLLNSDRVFHYSGMRVASILCFTLMKAFNSIAFHSQNNGKGLCFKDPNCAK